MLNEERTNRDGETNEADTRPEDQAQEGQIKAMIGRAYHARTADDLHELLQTLPEPLVPLALDAVVKHLDEEPGYLAGDHAQFHNVAMEAYRANQYAQGVVIVRAGLGRCEQSPPLMGDLVQGLRSQGLARDAVQVALEFWHGSSIAVFASDWRVGTFLVDTVRELDPSYNKAVPSDLQRYLEGISQDIGEHPRWGDILEVILKNTIDQNPYHIRLWHAIAQVRQARGDNQGAIECLKEAVQRNPLSQQLYFALGEMYLEMPDISSDADSGLSSADAAIEALQRALRADYQDQFQSDVNAWSVMLRLAQAYEARSALGDTAQRESDLLTAEQIYEQVVGQVHGGAEDQHANPAPEASGRGDAPGAGEEQTARASSQVPRHLREYATTRLRHLRTYQQVEASLQSSDSSWSEREVERVGWRGEERELSEQSASPVGQPAEEPEEAVERSRHLAGLLWFIAITILAAVITVAWVEWTVRIAATSVVVAVAYWMGAVLAGAGLLSGLAVSHAMSLGRPPKVRSGYRLRAALAAGIVIFVIGLGLLAYATLTHPYMGAGGG